jgi:archaemetzincin
LRCGQRFTTYERVETASLIVVKKDGRREEYDRLKLREGISGTAVVSTARLQNHFYGRTPCDDDLVDRVAKEGAHEIGHLLGLEHCPERECVMYAPRSLDELDRKRKMLCRACAARLDAR